MKLEQNTGKRRINELKELKNRTETEWVTAIERVDHDIRRPVAKLVWWDFFGNRFHENRAKGFDRYLGADTTEYADERFIEGLCQVGYPRHIAQSRLSGNGSGMHAAKD